MNAANDQFKLELLAQNEPPARLLGLILARVERERQRSLFRRRLAFLGVAAASFLAFIAATAYLVHDIRLSAFGQYLSLLSTDGGHVLSFWGEYVSSLAESLPLPAMAGCLLSLFVFLLALKLSAKYLNGSGHHHLPRPV